MRCMQIQYVQSCTCNYMYLHPAVPAAGAALKHLLSAADKRLHSAGALRTFATCTCTSRSDHFVTKWWGSWRNICIITLTYRAWLMTMCVALHAIVRLESKDVCRNFLRGGGGTAPIGRTHSHFSLAMGGSTSISGYFNRSYKSEKFRDMGGVGLALPGQRLHAPVLE